MDYPSRQSEMVEQARWAALLEREPQVGSAYVYGVVTTGVYCRPGCPSKLPNRENVRFFDTGQAAEQAGYRPCKRCRPDEPAGLEPHYQAIVQACQLMEEADEPPALADLADAAGLSPSHFHRLFKRMVGVTPKQYAMQQRVNRVRANLAESSTVTDALYEAGFASSSRFYEDAASTLGMKPSQYQNGGQGVRIGYTLAPCSLGWILVAATARGVCAIEFADAPDILEKRLRDRFPQATVIDDDPDLAAWLAQILSFLDSPQGTLDLPLDIQGTAFQRRVWMALRQIPAGITTTYGQVAAQIGEPRAARAVAQACASNRIALAIPCHRVVRQDGELGGYRWGRERKRQLLDREAQ